MLITSSNIDECHVLKSIPIAKLQICIELKTINMQINQACCFYSLFRSRVFCFVSSGQNHNRTHHTRVCSMSTTELKTTTTTNKQTKSLLCIFCVHLFLCADCFFADMAGNQQLLERFCTLCSILHPLHSRARKEENGTLLR